MKSSFCIDLQRFMLIPTKFPLSHGIVPSVYNSSMVLVILSIEIVYESKKCLVKSGKDIIRDT